MRTSRLPPCLCGAAGGALPPPPEVLKALQSTDFRETVLLEGYDGSTAAEASTAVFRPAEIHSYLSNPNPNRVELRANTATAGFLVLTDVWYPGWTCTVDGEPTTVYRANYVFRAVALPAGVHEVVFRFEPAS